MLSQSGGGSELADDYRGPKYIWIKNTIADRIRSEHLAPGEQVPSISEIMEQFNVSKVTAVRALAELEVEGVVQRKHGRGTFVSGLTPKNRMARSRPSVFIIVPDMTNPFYSEVVGNIEKHVRDEGIAIELASTNYQPEVEQRLLATILAEERVAGIALISTQGPHQFGEIPSDVPLVVIDHCPAELEGKCVSITCDNFAGGHSAAVHLASLGHERVGYINVPYGSPRRLDGFRRGFEEHGIELGDHWVMTLESAWQIETEVLNFVSRLDLTALASVNDMIAMQAMQALRIQGYKIPEDISLVGYDNVEAARFLDVPLTTIEQYEEQMGRKGAECLIEGIRAKGHRLRPREIVIVPNLVVRASTAACKSNNPK
jgi:DNA-binding LacI/PurR family transcriptional regulator